MNSLARWFLLAYPLVAGCGHWWDREDQDGDGFSAAEGDCWDKLVPPSDSPFESGAELSPAAIETWYDGFDGNCDGADDYDADADGYRHVNWGGYVCNDKRDDIYPGATEVREGAWVPLSESDHALLGVALGSAPVVSAEHTWSTEQLSDVTLTIGHRKWTAVKALGFAKGFQSTPWKIDGSLRATPGLLSSLDPKKLGAGEGSGFSDEAYSGAGAEIVDKKSLFTRAELIVKVKEPLPEEFEVNPQDNSANALGTSSIDELRYALSCSSL